MNKIIGLYSNEPYEAEQLIRAALCEGYNQPVLFTEADNHSLFTTQFGIHQASSMTEAQQLTIKKFGLKADFGVPDYGKSQQPKDKGCAVDKVHVPVEPQQEREKFGCDVIIPYSRANYPYLKDAAKSVLNQNFVTVTVHLINDGMKHDPIGYQFARECSNVRWYRNTDGPVGPYVTYNRLFDYLEYDVFANQDSDDISLPMRLYRSLKMIHAGYDIVGGSMEQFVNYDDVDHRMQKALTIKPYHYSGTIWKAASPSGSVVNSTAVMRKSVYEEANGMAPWIAGADSEFYERCILAGYKAAAIQDIVALRRLHSPSLSNNQVTSGHGSGLREDIKRWTQESIEQQRIATDHSIGGLAKHRHDKELEPLSVEK